MQTEFTDIQCELADQTREQGIKIRYGTTGIRFAGEKVVAVAYRCGVIVGILSKYFHPKCIGLVITASHNPIQDNGLKIVDTEGAMLPGTLEKAIERFLNEKDINVGAEKIHAELTEMYGADHDMAAEGVIHVARDTRPTSVTVLELLTQGVQDAGSKVIDHGLLSTPLIHYFVNRRNNYGTENLLQDYISSTWDAFVSFTKQFENPAVLQKKLVIDCANGVGYLVLQKYLEYAGDSLPLEIIPINKDNLDKLNSGCGSDFVHTRKTFPSEFEFGQEVIGTTVDGDADRSFFYFKNAEDKFCMVEGTRMSAVFGLALTAIIKELVEAAEEAGSPLAEEAKKWTLGVVYTGYSNNNGIRFIRDECGFQVKIAKTGVKYVHHAAQTFDFGIYFESNGHGDITYDRKYIDSLVEQYKDVPAGNFRTKLDQLFNFCDIINDTDGDAIANILVFIASMMKIDYTIEKIFDLYVDLPWKSMKVVVPNRHVIKVSEDEQSVLEPADLQPAIDAIIANYPDSRSFVRPSGTENLVRVFVEAQDEAIIQEIGDQVKEAVASNPTIKNAAATA